MRISASIPVVASSFGKPCTHLGVAHIAITTQASPSICKVAAKGGRRGVALNLPYVRVLTTLGLTLSRIVGLKAES